VSTFDRQDRISIYVVVFVIVILTIVTRLPTLWLHVIDIDEAIWAVSANMLIDGYIPYVEFADNKPLGVVVFMAAIFKAAGGMNLIAVHIATMIVVALTAFAIYRLASNLKNQRSGLAAAVFYILFITNYIPKVISTNVETLMNLPLVLSMLALISAYDARRSLNIFLAGICIGIACCFKYQAGVTGILIAAAIFFGPPRKGDGESFAAALAKGIFLFAAGSLIPFAIMLMYILYVGAFDEYVALSLAGSMSYISAGGAGLHIGRQILVRLGTYLIASSPLWILAAMRIADIFKHGEGRWKEFVIVSWLLFSSIPVMIGWRLYGHYFLLWVPALSILAGIELAHQLENWKTSRTARIVSAVIIIMSVFFTISFAVPRYYLDRVNRAAGEDNPFDYIPIAEAVHKKTADGDFIFVWGFAPSIYYFSGRTPASRFLWSDYLTGRSSLPGKVENLDVEKFVDPRAWDKWLADVEKRKPALIIDTAPAKLHDAHFYPMKNYKMLSDYVAKHYEYDSSINGANLYRRKKD
jgi:hypothetical protein